MTHRIVSVVVSLILALFVGAAFVFALAIQVRVPAAAGGASAILVPHPTDARAGECPDCHRIEGGSLPLTHRNYDRRACLNCHPSKIVLLVPHSISMGNGRCVICHGDPDSDFGIPRDHVAFTDKRCLFCHRGDGAKSLVDPKPLGEFAVAKPRMTHPASGAFRTCTYCHRIGGQPSMPRSHAWFDTGLCLVCHRPPAPVSAVATTP